MSLICSLLLTINRWIPKRLAGLFCLPCVYLKRAFNINSKDQIMRILFIYCLLGCALLSCRKLIEVGEPTDKIVREEEYSTNENATAVMAGIYAYMNTSGLSTGGRGISIFCGL